ncbi:MAG TPA: ATP/GTP-binding protein, partial [Actinomycetota bacterium]|nr:ATP/GTP-binding protein [Actinomycetota bacterium]
MTAPSRLIRRRGNGVGASARPLKIVVTGPFSAGKTTLIKTISEVAVVGTERDVTDETSAVKHKTTVAMDFGRLTFSDGVSLFLFGTPGQRRFEMMWEILSEGMIGFIVLVHAAEPLSLEEAGHILQTFRRYADVPYVVGLTHLDQTADDPDDIAAKVRIALDLPPEVPVLPCDPRGRSDVKKLLLAVLLG